MRLRVCSYLRWQTGCRYEALGLQTSPRQTNTGMRRLVCTGLKSQSRCRYELLDLQLSEVAE